jgi:tRNA (adenine57-N1/adenine58-N1)-methyltransferase
MNTPLAPPPALEPGPFGDGDLCLFIDSRRRRYLVRLQSGATFHTHAGTLAHDEVIGRFPGMTVTTSHGLSLLALRPRPKDYVLEMRRAAQVVYPKDYGAILGGAGVVPGMKVLEIGLGSGSLAIATLLAIGSSGRLVSIETRWDHAERGTANVAGYFGTSPDNHSVIVGDATRCLGGSATFDACLVDIAEPWRVLAVVHRLLRPGRYVACYSPSTTQVARTVEEMRRQYFGAIETVEVIERPWHIEGQSVRPQHRMVGHTGFVTVGAKLAL